MEFDLSSYISQEQAEEIFRDCCNSQIKGFLARHCGGSPAEICKIVGYGIKSVLEDIVLENDSTLRTEIENKLPEIIDTLSAYDLFYTKDGVIHAQDSVGRKILNEELASSRDRIRGKIEQVLDRYNWEYVTEDIVTDVLYEAIRDRLFGRNK